MPDAAQGASPATLDELMLAMDVVDTLRHQDNLVARELDETRREAELIERLRKLYKGQGIEVPDRVLKEGVAALRESRFVYEPPKPGLATTLALLWVTRARWGRRTLVVLAALAIAAAAYFVTVSLPAQRAAERERAELTQILPASLSTGHAEAVAEARVAAARERADRILADGRAALARRDAEGARRALAELEELRADLRREYTLRIVSRPGESTGVWRVPDRNRRARNYYLVVEAVAPDGALLSLPVTSEEDGRTATVSKWGVRVSEEVFNAVRRDKDADGIVQRNRLGVKNRGFLDVEYLMPVLGGAITQW